MSTKAGKANVNFVKLQAQRKPNGQGSFMQPNGLVNHTYSRINGVSTAQTSPSNRIGNNSSHGNQLVLQAAQGKASGVRKGRIKIEKDRKERRCTIIVGPLSLSLFLWVNSVQGFAINELFLIHRTILYLSTTLHLRQSSHWNP